MSKFNQKQTVKTTNREGNPAYAMHAKSKLVTQVLTSFFNEAKFYGDNSDEMQQTIAAVIKTDPAFVSKLAVFARREFNMRSVSHVLTAYLAHEPEGKPFVRDTVRGVTVRGDDVTEIMAFYLNTFGKPVPNSLKRGIGEVMRGFDARPAVSLPTQAEGRGAGRPVEALSGKRAGHARDVGNRTLRPRQQCRDVGEAD